MGSSEERSLADDEAELARIARRLEQELLAAVPGWVARSVADAAGSSYDRQPAGEREADVAKTAHDVGLIVAPQLRRVFDADVDAGAGNPLAVLRDGVGPMTELLARWAVEPNPRDPFHVDRFPADPYQLGPANFADVHGELHDLGLRWGAARAHVHLRRRREANGG